MSTSGASSGRAGGGRARAAEAVRAHVRHQLERGGQRLDVLLLVLRHHAEDEAAVQQRLGRTSSSARASSRAQRAACAHLLRVGERLGDPAAAARRASRRGCRKASYSRSKSPGPDSPSHRARAAATAPRSWPRAPRPRRAGDMSGECCATRTSGGSGRRRSSSRSREVASASSAPAFQATGPPNSRACMDRVIPRQAARRNPRAYADRMANIRTPDPGLKLDLAGKTTYGDYLRLDRLLSAQEPRCKPEHHDELLFIIQHQTRELWMKLLIHELDCAALRCVQRGPSSSLVQDLRARRAHPADAVRAVERAGDADAQRVLGVPATRWARRAGSSLPVPGARVPAGQQGRECAAGRIATAPEVHAWLERSLREPSLYDEFLRYLARRGPPVPHGAAGARLFRALRAAARGGGGLPDDLCQIPSSTGTGTRCARSSWTWRSDSSSGVFAT